MELLSIFCKNSRELKKTLIDFLVRQDLHSQVYSQLRVYIISFCQFGAIQLERVRTFVKNCCNKQCLFVCSKVRRLTFSQLGFFYYSFFLISRSSNFNSYHSSKKIKWKSRMKRRKMISLKIWKVWLERERERDVLSEDVGGESYNCMK